MTSPRPLSPREQIEHLALHSSDQRVKLGALRELQRIAEQNSGEALYVPPERIVVTLDPDGEVISVVSDVIEEGALRVYPGVPCPHCGEALVPFVPPTATEPAPEPAAKPKRKRKPAKPKPEPEPDRRSDQRTILDVDLSRAEAAAPHSSAGAAAPATLRRPSPSGPTSLSPSPPD